MNAALSGLVVWGVGCIIPTPLDQASAEQNFPPVFVTSKVQPQFGPIGPLTQTQALSINFVASDPNRGDRLNVRLFELINGMLIATGQMLPLSDPDPNEPTAIEHTGQLDLALCAGRAPSSTHLIYAVVADRDFVSPTSAEPKGGLSDQNHWELSCL